MKKSIKELRQSKKRDYYYRLHIDREIMDRVRQIIKEFSMDHYPKKLSIVGIMRALLCNWIEEYEASKEKPAEKPKTTYGGGSWIYAYQCDKCTDHTSWVDVWTNTAGNRCPACGAIQEKPVEIKKT